MALAHSWMLAVDSPISTWLPPTLMLIGVVFLGIIMILAVKNHRRQSSQSSALASPPRTEAAAYDRASMSDRRRTPQLPLGSTAMDDMLSSAQRLSTALEMKSQHVEELLAAADQRIAELSALLEHNLSAQSDVADIVPPQVESMTIETRPSTAAAILKNRAPTPALTVEQLAAEVHRLADAGKRPVDIARELNEGVGKIELILALRRTAETARR